MSNDEYARKKASLENLPKFNEDMKDRYDQVKAFFHNVILKRIFHMFFKRDHH